MTVLLRLLHGKIVKSPDVETFDELFDLVTSAARYDLVHLLCPWTEEWLEQLKKSAFKHAAPGDPEVYPQNFNGFKKQLSVAWDLGDSVLFNLMAMRILLQAEVSDDGDLLDPTGEPLKSDARLSAMGLFDTLHSRRNQLIQSVLQPVDQVLDTLLKSHGPKHCCVASEEAFRNCTANSAPKYRSDCSMVILGSLIRGLTSAILFPIPDSADIFESIESLAHRVQDVLAEVSPISGLDGMRPSGK